MKTKISLIPCMGCEKIWGKLGFLAAMELEKSEKFPLLNLNPSISQIAAGEYPPISEDTQIVSMNCCGVKCATKILSKAKIKPNFMINLSNFVKEVDIPKGNPSTAELLKHPALAKITELIASEITKFNSEIGVQKSEKSVGSMEKFTFEPQYSEILEFTYSKFIFKVPVSEGRLFFNWNDAWAYHLGDGKVVIGITDYLQKNLSDILICDFMEMGSEIGQFEAVAEVESSKTVNEVLTPFSGKIIAVNTQLEQAPELMNEDPYGKGWAVVLQCSNFAEESADLMNSQQYFEFMKEKVEEEGAN